MTGDNRKTPGCTSGTLTQSVRPRGYHPFSYALPPRQHEESWAGPTVHPHPLAGSNNLVVLVRGSGVDKILACQPDQSPEGPQDPQTLSHRSSIQCNPRPLPSEHHGRSQKERQIPFDRHCQRAMLRYLHQRTDSLDWLWITEAGSRLAYDSIWQDLKRLSGRAGVDLQDA